MNEFAFVDVAITEPDVDGVEPGDVAEDFKAHLFPNLTDGTLTVTLPFPHMTFGKGPLAITIHDHRKVDGPALAFKHQPSGRHFGAMSFTLAATFA